MGRFVKFPIPGSHQYINVDHIVGFRAMDESESRTWENRTSIMVTNSGGVYWVDMPVEDVAEMLRDS